MVHGLRCPLISSVEQDVLILVYIETCIRQTIAYLEKTKIRRGDLVDCLSLFVMVYSFCQLVMHSCSVS